VPIKKLYNIVNSTINYFNIIYNQKLYYILFKLFYFEIHI